jgi:hypothetical protein
LFSDCRSGWSKEPQWENDCGFSQCFLLVKATIKCRLITTTMRCLQNERQ